MDEIRKIVFWITGIIVAIIIVASVILFFSISNMTVPATPALISSTNETEQNAKTKEIANYKEVVSSLQLQRTNVYDFVVLKTLLPVFNTLIVSVLGYIFARTLLLAYRSYITGKYNKV